MNPKLKSRLVEYIKQGIKQEHDYHYSELGECHDSEKCDYEVCYEGYALIKELRKRNR